MQPELKAAIEAARKLVAAAQARFDREKSNLSAMADRSIARADGSGRQDRGHEEGVDAASRDFAEAREALNRAHTALAALERV